MDEKDKRITELKAIIKEYKENLSNKNNHITELEEKLGGDKNMPLVESLIMEEKDECNYQGIDMSQGYKNITELEEKLGGDGEYTSC